ncbi:hypothetical protein LQZ19_16610 [Treponema primitia]|uniref:hypothetical protein n=1 Tax=Treponema primitia TaxID=88058 RepID=UPI00397FBF4C
MLGLAFITTSEGSIGMDVGIPQENTKTARAVKMAKLTMGFFTGKLLITKCIAYGRKFKPFLHKTTLNNIYLKHLFLLFIGKKGQGEKHPFP